MIGGVIASVRGKLLVSTPPLLDPNFLRTVVLVLEHNAEGALGVVLNRPSDTHLAEVLPRWGPLAVAPGLVHIGGPVQPAGMIALARVGRLDVVGAPEVADVPDVSGLRPLWPGVATVDLEASPEHLDAAVDGVRCFVGYAGWSPGQLDAELADGSWFAVDLEPGDLWTPDASDLWRSVLRRQPGRLSHYALCPVDPSTN